MNRNTTASTISVVLILCGATKVSANPFEQHVAHTTKPVKVVIEPSEKEVFYFGPDLFWLDEHTHLKEAHLKDRTFFGGLRVGYDDFRPNKVYKGIDGLFAWGNAKLNVKEKEIQPKRGNGYSTFANLEGRVGYNLSSPLNFTVTPFIGLGGYHTRHTHSIHYTQDWLYVALGFKSNYLFGEVFSLGFNAKGMNVVYLEQHVEKDGISGCRHSTTNNLGYEISVPLAWNLGNKKRWNVEFEPYYSKLSTKNNANMVGARILLGCLF